MTVAEVEAAKNRWHAAVPDLLDAVEREPGARGLFVRALSTLGSSFDASLSVRRLLDSLFSDMDAPRWASALWFEPALGLIVESLAETAPSTYRGEHLISRIRNRLAELTSFSPDASASTGVPGHVRALIRRRDRDCRYRLVDLLADTVQDCARTETQREELYLAFNAVPTVDRALASLDRMTRLAHEAGPHAILHLLPLGEPMAVGQASSNDGRSLELAALLAALSGRCGWRWKHDRVVVTGSLLVREDGIGVTPVADLEDKLAAVLDWARDLGPGAREAVVILPRDPGYVAAGAERSADAASRLIGELKALGAEVHLVKSLKEVLAPGVLPWRRRTAHEPSALVPAFVTWIWYAERLVGGEWLADPAMRSGHGLFPYALVSMLPALLPAAGVWLAMRRALSPTWIPARPRSAGGDERRGRRLAKARLFAWLLPLLVFPSWLLFLLQWLLGGLDFPLDTPYLPHPDPKWRIVFVFKDLGAFYPLLLVALVGILIRERAVRMAPEGLREGRFLEPNWMSIMEMGSFPGKKYVIPGLLLVTVAGFLLNAHWFMGEFRWCINHGNIALFTHIAYQVAFPTVAALLLAFYLATGPKD